MSTSDTSETPNVITEPDAPPTGGALAGTRPAPGATTRAPLLIALLALGVATAALPPVWVRLDEIAAATLAQLHPPILTLADTDRETTGTVAKSEADLRALLSAAAVVPFVGGTTAAEPVGTSDAAPPGVRRRPL